MAFELTGKLIEKGKTQQVSGSFKKREFVIEKKEVSGGMEYLDYVKFQLTQDRCSLIDPFRINDDIKVYFNVRGKRWEKDGQVSYFTNLSAWKIERVTEEEGAAPPSVDYTKEDIPPEQGKDDDLPF
jgi:hypothetical protein